ncbi:unnamed protein product [Dracunculus medinensis]|uniref:SRP54_N domain-containing protein n=1 Tax=Dracunculus medinensis TaxID=318479 RepID=A0A0N4UCB4_DRAME|nr:unnamed protein product [Dracunculus medinensis]
MIELFTIFGKGGIVLWCFQEGSQLYRDTINQFIKEVLMQERVNSSVFKYNNVMMKYRLDNEFELIVYQSAIQLSYGDQLLTDVHRKFRDMYKNVLSDNKLLFGYTNRMFDGFREIYMELQKSSFVKPEKIMRKFEESDKSKKTVASMLERPSDRGVKQQIKEKELKSKMMQQQFSGHSPINIQKNNINEIVGSPQSSPKADLDDGEIRRKRAEFFKKKGGKKASETEKSSLVDIKKGKKARTWGVLHNGNVADAQVLDYSETNEKASVVEEDRKFLEEQKQFVGQMKGELPGLDQNQNLDQNQEENLNGQDEVKSENDGWFSAFKSLVGNKKLTSKDIGPVVDRMRENLFAKNVAAAAAEKLCDSVAAKLEGKVVGTFSLVTSIIRESFREALTQILTPKRRVDILRDIIEAKNENRPYVVIFCGVNGVGKSTNLAKITFWLNENGY